MRRFLSHLVPAIVLMLALGLACKKPQPALSKVAEGAEQAPTAAPAVRKRVLDAPVWTQTIAVLDTNVTAHAPAGVDTEITQTVTEAIESSFVATGRFDLVERARLGAVRRELTTTSDSLLFDQTSVAKMGRFLGARYVILPSARMEVGLWGTRLDLLIKVLDTETAMVVQTIPARTSSSSLSTNSSITACLDRIRLEVTEALAPIYPAQAMIIHSPKDGIFWAEAKQVRLGFKPGARVRILEPREVFNIAKGTASPFMIEAGRGRVQSVESTGIIIRCPGVTADEGWLVEVLP